MAAIVALTGATGFIGQQVARLLHEAGWSVRILVRSPNKLAKIANVVSEQVPGSLEDRESLYKLTHNAFAVVHCAGAVRGATQSQFDRVNAEGLGNLAEAAAAQDSVSRILVLSSLAAREPGLSPYAASKHKGEALLAKKTGGKPWVALRPPAVYGPGDRELLPLFRLMGQGVAPLLGGREARFSMLHVQDLAAAVLALLEQQPLQSGVFELHDGRVGGYSWQDVITLISHLCRRKVWSFKIPSVVLQLPASLNWLAGRYLDYAPMLTPGKLRELTHSDWVCDNQAITRMCGWRPKIGLEEGLRNLPGWAGYRG